MATENILTVILILKEILLIFLIAQVVKNQPPKQETQIRSLGQEDPTPVFLPGKSHGQRSLVGLQSMGLQS